MTYTWNVGGTTYTTSGSTTASPALTAATTYTVRVTNSNGCVGNVSLPAAIAINQLPVATVSARTICSGGTATLSATLGAGTTTQMTYTWNVGGTSRTTTVNTFTSQPLTATTNYTVQLRNSNGCVGNVSSPATITVNPLPAATVTPVSMCSGGMVTLRATLGAGTTTGMVYTWNVGGSIRTGSTTTTTYNAPTTTVITRTTYTVQLRNNSTNCLGPVSAPATITVNPLPVVETLPAAMVCDGETVDLSAKVSGGTTTAMTYTWNVSGVSRTTTGSTFTSQTLTANTTYTVRVTNSNGCVGTAAPAAITKHSKPAITLISGSEILGGRPVSPLGIYIRYKVPTGTTVTLSSSSFSSYPEGVYGHHYQSYDGPEYRIEVAPAAGVSGTYSYELTANAGGVCSTTLADSFVVIPFASTNTWPYDNKTLSDEVLLAPQGCYNYTERILPDDITHPGVIVWGSVYYTWSCVYAFKDVLCPSPWRVPEAMKYGESGTYPSNHFTNLHHISTYGWSGGYYKAGSEYTTKGGRTKTNEFDKFLWSQTSDYFSGSAYGYSSKTGDVSGFHKGHALPLRCVMGGD
jgi:hypothetical protein